MSNMSKNYEMVRKMLLQSYVEDIHNHLCIYGNAIENELNEVNGIRIEKNELSGYRYILELAEGTMEYNLWYDEEDYKNYKGEIRYEKYDTSDLVTKQIYSRHVINYIIWLYKEFEAKEELEAIRYGEWGIDTSKNL